MNDRGRITPPDVVYLLVSIGVLAVVGPVFLQVLDDNAYTMGTGSVYLMQLVIPTAVLVLLTLVYVTTIGGSS